MGLKRIERKIPTEDDFLKLKSEIKNFKQEIKELKLELLILREREESRIELRKSLTFEKEEEEILCVWRTHGGKVPQRPGTKVLSKVKNSIDRLLRVTTNEYVKVDDDPEFADKIWTVKEICDCIHYYVFDMKKKIERMYFNDFIVFAYNNRESHLSSPIMEAFLNMGENYVQKEDFVFEE